MKNIKKSDLEISKITVYRIWCCQCIRVSEEWDEDSKTFLEILNKVGWKTSDVAIYCPNCAKNPKMENQI